MRGKEKLILIRCRTLIDGISKKPKKDIAILVEGERIKAVGKATEIKVSRKTKHIEIDASEMTVMPGLIDSHLHLIGLKTDRILEEELVRPPQLGLIKSVYDAGDLLGAGFTTVKDCGGFGIYLKRAIAEGTMRGPRILSAGYTLSQTAGHGDVHFVPVD